jgi:signal transduction histidine kinase
MQRQEPSSTSVSMHALGVDGGAGLGLPIARWIAEAHGGRLQLERSGATGSVFMVTLPRSSVDN